MRVSRVIYQFMPHGNPGSRFLCKPVLNEVGTPAKLQPTAKGGLVQLSSYQYGAERTSCHTVSTLWPWSSRPLRSCRRHRQRVVPSLHTTGPGCRSEGLAIPRGRLQDTTQYSLTSHGDRTIRGNRRNLLVVDFVRKLLAHCGPSVSTVWT